MRKEGGEFAFFLLSPIVCFITIHQSYVKNMLYLKSLKRSTVYHLARQQVNLELTVTRPKELLIFLEDMTDWR